MYKRENSIYKAALILQPKASMKVRCI